MSEPRWSDDAVVVPFARRWWMIDEIELVPLVAEQAQLAILCDALEACADALPAAPEEAVAARLCARLDQVAARGETGAVEALAARLDTICGDPLALAMLDRCGPCRMADAVHAQDLAAMLRAGTNAGISPDALAYMLRCFFTGCRRTMDLELLALLALARNRLTAEARMLLSGALARRAA
ncbi:hypothetical protein [Sphingomonas sp.]|uniref:hypothetical protein n=1 Tax=Sphingomonas sp. TaxID=28214 RepID=UPI001B0364A7|nr:hypothetical protein [Sphingomonas sp.]MBO9713286.1 hypothetical protein [Sphingomonas sp.]